MNAREFFSLLRKGLLCLLCLVFLLPLGCSPNGEESSLPSPTPEATPSPAPAPDGTLSGIVLSYDGSTLTIQAQDGQEYQLDASNTQWSGLPNPGEGDAVTVEYQGDLESGENLVALQAEKTGEPGDSIPASWRDDGIFSDSYSKAYVALQSMSTEEKVGQLLLGRVPETGAGDDVVAYHLGGYVTFGRDYEDKTRWQVQNMIQGWQSVAEIPLLVAVDEEGGEVVRVSSNPNLRSTPFRSPQLLYAMGGMDRIQEDAEEKAQLLLDLGINVNLAPVADVSTNPEDFIYSRTLGQGPEETAEYVTTVMEAFHKEGLSSVLKHFPGYGSNDDTHAGASLDERSLYALENRDLVPFQAGIDDGAYAIMVSHNTVACMDDTLPASLSPKVHQYLREEMGFTGVILTDDLSMEAIAGQDFGLEHSAYVQAFLAGNDILLCSDYQTAYHDLLEAVETGVIPPEMLDHAVFRILAWKGTLGLM